MALDSGGVTRRSSPLQELLGDERLERAGVRVWVKRDDLIHPELPGNKWRKLAHNLAAAREQGAHTLLTFGGAYSNHIRATAAAGRLYGFATVGVIRGEEHRPLNPTLRYAVEQGMRLTYLDRGTYRLKHTEAVLDPLRREWGDHYLLPEGGSNNLAVLGCAELPTEIEIEYDLICCPVGTGATLAGIAGGLPPAAQALGFAVLKGADFLNVDVARLQEQTWGRTSDNWRISLDHHFGGYAKHPPELRAFAADLTARHGVPLDLTYTAKMLAGIYTLAAQGAFPPCTRLIAVLTG